MSPLTKTIMKQFNGMAHTFYLAQSDRSRIEDGIVNWLIQQDRADVLTSYSFRWEEDTFCVTFMAADSLYWFTAKCPFDYMSVSNILDDYDRAMRGI
jgi:NDP-sugar pyrophosphorylase family protein